jgi:hypothetical protein
MAVNAVEAHVAYKALHVDYPSVGLVDQEGDRPFSMLSREALRRIEAAPIGSNDFGMPPDRKPGLYVAGDRPT